MKKVLSFFKRVLPKFRVVKFLEGDAISFRWGNFGCDAVTSNMGYHLIQYGRRGGVVKFICRISKKAEKPPLFLLADKWRAAYRNKNIIAGETDSPLSLSKLWR